MECKYGCEAATVAKKGKTKRGAQRYRCIACKRSWAGIALAGEEMPNSEKKEAAGKRFVALGCAEMAKEAVAEVKEASAVVESVKRLRTFASRVRTVGKDNAQELANKREDLIYGLGFLVLGPFLYVFASLLVVWVGVVLTVEYLRKRWRDFSSRVLPRKEVKERMQA